MIYYLCESWNESFSEKWQFKAEYYFDTGALDFFSVFNHLNDLSLNLTLPN